VLIYLSQPQEDRFTILKIEREVVLGVEK